MPRSFLFYYIDDRNRTCRMHFYNRGLWPVKSFPSPLQGAVCSLLPEILLHWRVRLENFIWVAIQVFHPGRDAQSSTPSRPEVLHGANSCLIHQPNLWERKVLVWSSYYNNSRELQLQGQSSSQYTWLTPFNLASFTSLGVKRKQNYQTLCSRAESSQLSKGEPSEAVRECQIKHPYGKDMGATVPSAAAQFSLL